ncbi:MAG: DUF4349 domain-containing protein [Lachnospiraceae bacterium]|nr:DUF4349 domain-containing protein [Lachnospiraceae bacterium]
MDCDKAFEMMSLYIDEELNKEEQEKLFEHINDCDYCKEEFDLLKDLVGKLKKEEFLPLPEGYHEELMAKVNDSKIQNLSFWKSNIKNKPNWKKYGSIAAAGLLVFVVGAAASSMNFDRYSQSETATAPMAAKSQAYNETTQMPTAVEKEVTTEEYSADAGMGVLRDMGADIAGDVNAEASNPEVKVNVDERKKIKTAYITITVENFEQAVENIRAQIESNSGYVENFNSYVYQQNSDESLKAGNITLRMDKEYYEQMKIYVKSMGKVTYEDENVNDITSQYIDTQGRLKAKRVEEERLLELLASAENIQDIIAIEERLGNIRSDIESYQSTIDNWDKLVDLSTINVELKEEEPASVGTISSDFGTKVRKSFIGSVNMLVKGFQSIVLGLVSISLPLLVIAGVVSVTGIIIIKKWKKHRS